MRKWIIILAIVVLAAGAAFAVLDSLATRLVRERLVSELQQRFGGEAEYQSIHASLFPSPRLAIAGLVLRYRGRRDLPPLIRMQKLSARAGWFALLWRPRHVASVRMEGLQIHVPPRGERGEIGPQKAPEEKPADKPSRSPSVIVDEITTGDALLVILPREAGKRPLEFRVHNVKMKSAGAGKPWPFQATLKNAKPPGEIRTEGQFGPWRSDEPSLTPLAATYAFTGANLGVFRGISGTLSSKGRFHGVLERIDVQGETDTPDFSVRVSGHRVHLRTEFRAIVDGTNGDTFLEPVHARFLTSSVVANGGVYRIEKLNGRTVSLDVNVKDARVEDLLRLAVKSKTPLTGRMSFLTKFELPPGPEDIADKLELNGEFGIAAARFTKLNLREKVQELSRKGQGRPEDDSAGSDISDLAGRFRLRDGVVTFSNLTFKVPGATVLLNGSYGLETEGLDFRGQLRLAAPLSQTTTGAKSFFLKLLDPFFKKKDAGAVLPIKIQGTREKPDFGLDVGGGGKRD
jgi:uncharacterized protein involved in outer membrane biogenesis